MPIDCGFISHLQHICGAKHILTHGAQTRRYRKGFRFGEGKVLAVARPATMVEMWRVLRACVAANKIIIVQAANTGLTGGSTPDGDYDRDIVIINTLRIQGIQPINNAAQVICLAGATLDKLEKTLKPLGREPHSVIGSSCIGASVVGGVCNSSGGALVRRGPAYSELALYAQVGADGELRLTNSLGIALGNEPEEILDRLERGDYQASDIQNGSGAASDHRYADHVRDIEAATPARFNADPGRLHTAAGCAGKLAVFAVRLDTFAAEKETKVFYIGTDDADKLARLRRQMLAEFHELPIAAEYMHRDAYDIAEKYGKDMFLAIRAFGTGRIPALFSAKSRFDAFAERIPLLPRDLSDRLLQALSRLFPAHLPSRMTEYRKRFEHHLMLKISGTAAPQTRAYLQEFFADAHFECTPDEGAKAFLHRFAAAGAAVRYRAVHARGVSGIVALDIALRRNDTEWVERLPPHLSNKILHKLYYGHFFCHVFHQDYIVKAGEDCMALEHAMLALLEARGAEYPAEHNVGHLYAAKPALAAFYKEQDPCNCFNPGIGHTSKKANWA